MRITRRRADDAVEPGCRTEWCGGRVRSRGKSQSEPCITSAVCDARRPVRSRGLLVLAIVLLVTFARPFLSSWLETAPPPAVARQETQQVLDALVGDIEAFRTDFHGVPKTLVQVGIPLRGRWSHTVVGTGR
jgi:hypothetical protein